MHGLTPISGTVSGRVLSQGLRLMLSVLSALAFSHIGQASASTHQAGKPSSVAPTPVIATGLELPSHAATAYAWLDNHHLAVTTNVNEEGDKGSAYRVLRRIVVVDRRTGEQKELLHRGFLACTNPHTGLVLAYQGDLRQLFRNAGAPAPEMKLYRWSAKELQLKEVPAVTGELPIHPALCRPHDPDQDRNGQLMTGVAAVRYLEPEHGQLRWTEDWSNQSLVDGRLERGTYRRKLDMEVKQVAPNVQWLAFRRAYLLAAGSYDDYRNQQRESPLVLMSLQGQLTKQAMPMEVKQLMKEKSIFQAFSVPVREGLLVLLPGRSSEGAGIYLHSKAPLRRLFCARPSAWPPDLESGHEEPCFEDDPVQVSPDGCGVSFVTGFDFEGRYRHIASNGEVHVLNLCTEAHPMRR